MNNHFNLHIMKALLKYSLVVLMLLVSSFICAQKGMGDDGNLSGRKKKKVKVGLVLCGGGAKGVAHIGVIRKLEEVGIRPDVIVGTSIGSLVGGLYAMGYDSKQLDTIVSNADWNYLLSNSVQRSDVSFSKKLSEEKYFISIPFGADFKELRGRKEEESAGSILKNFPSGFCNGNNVLNLLNGLAVGYQDSISFDKLPIPFACIATDLSTGDEVVLDHGYLPLCMRASMSIPGFFNPVKIDGKVLVDGGVVNNFPVDIARKKGADIVIGVDVQSDLIAPDELESLDAVLLQLISLMGNDKFLENKKDANIYIKPDVSKFGTMSFNKEACDTLLVNGYKAADEKNDVLVALKKLLGEQNGADDTVLKARNIQESTFHVTNILFEGIDPEDEKWLMNLSGLKRNNIISGKEINQAISLFNGTDAFSQVTFLLSEDKGNNGAYILKFFFKPAPSNVISIGARYDTEEAAAMLLHLGIKENTLHGGRGAINFRLGFNPNANFSYGYVFRNFPRLDVNYYFKKTDVNIYSDKDSRNNIKFIYNGLEAAFANLKYFRTFDARLGVRLDNYKFLRFLTEKEKEVNTKAKSYLSVFTEAQMDNRDDQSFPTNGIQTKVRAAYYMLGFHGGFKSFASIYGNISGVWSPAEKFAVIPQLYTRINIKNKYEFPYYNYVGGSEEGRYVDHQIPFVGINYTSVFDNSLLVLRTDFRYNFAKKHYAYIIANYLRSGHEVGNMLSFKHSGLWGFGLQYSYRTKIGPLSFNIHWSDYNKKKVGAYLSLGYFF